MNKPQISSVLGTLKRAVYPISSTLVTKAQLVEGTLKGGTVPFRSLFVNHTNYNEHFKHRIYEGEPKVLRTWRLLIPTLRRLIVKKRVDFDLCVAVLPRFYDRILGDICDFQGREEVQQVIDTSGGWEAMRGEFAKKKRQTTNNFSERYGLSYRISKSVEEFDHFYYRMHVPHIQRRYGELSQIDRYEDMKEFFHKGMLLFVTKDDKPLAGAISLIEDKTIVFRRTGVLDGDETNVKGGAQTALYYFQLKYAAENGFRAVDAMKSAPFLNDGVFRHKSEWGACSLRDDEAPTSVFFFTRGPNDKLAQFFDANPMVADLGSRLRGVVGDPKPGVAVAAIAEDIERRYHMKGLEELLIYTPDGPKTVRLTAKAPAPASPDEANPRPAKDPAKGSAKAAKVAAKVPE